MTDTDGPPPAEDSGRAAPPEAFAPWRKRLHTIIFEADTPAGKAFDVGLIAAILVSVLTVLLESVEEYRTGREMLFLALEWGFTLLFTAEYALRLACVRRPLRYVRGFFGIIDLLAVLPTYLSLLLPGAGVLRVVRILRVLRVFRVFKLAQYVKESQHLAQALRASRRKIAVFLFAVLALVVVLGAIMYVLEGGENGFTNIPRSIYWAIVTLTTVGYGDISPGTAAGQALAAFIMILGYGIIAVPTGIVSAEMAAARPVTTQACPSCGAEGHDPDARFCKLCGAGL